MQWFAICDSTIALPLMTSYALAKRKKPRLGQLYDQRGALMTRLKSEFEKTL